MDVLKRCLWPLAAGLAFAACGGEAEGGGPQAAIVDTVHVRGQDVPNIVTAVGTVEADHQTAVMAEVSGRVVAILHDEGSRVAAGTPVIQLDPGDYRNETQSAAAELSRAEALLEADSKQLERFEKLLEAGAVDQATYDDLVARVESDKAAVQQARAELGTARLDLGRSSIRAPFAGTVGKRHVQLGEYVSGGGDGSAVFDLVDDDPLKVRFSIPEVYATDVEQKEGGYPEIIDFARGADLLIHDAQYLREEYFSNSKSKKGWGHSTIEMAVEVAKKAHVKRLALFHHEPLHDDRVMRSIERRAKELFPKTLTAREQSEVRL